MKSQKTTLIIGASLKHGRYSNILMQRLSQAGMPAFGIGATKGQVGSITIDTATLALENVHTISIYLREELQGEYEDYILALKPKRIIFNPGAENKNLKLKAESIGIEAINACSLVMLQTGQY